MNSFSTRPALGERTLQFAANVRSFAKRLPRVVGSGNDVQELLRAAAGIGACNIEANEAPNKTEFVAKIRQCLKEAKEATFWLRLIDTGPSDSLTELKAALVQESREFMRIYFAILRKLRTKSKDE
ncbi:hypothetical protein BH10PLA2_BH10PLA2_25040 [soil metagenome]